MQVIDTHAHLDDESFEGSRHEVVERARRVGVVQIISVGTTAASSQQTVELARQSEMISAAVGIQPNYCAEVHEGDWETVARLSSDPAVVAIGETGLDRYWDYTPFDQQQDYFDRHLRLSQSSNLPFIVHMRDCGGDILVMLREARERGPLRGVMHSFTGDTDMARECMEMGLYIGFAGMVTFKKSDELREVAISIPGDRILVETDSPYLSPHPKRGVRPNEPSHVVLTLECLAETRNVPVRELAQATSANARVLFDRMA